MLQMHRLVITFIDVDDEALSGNVVHVLRNVEGGVHDLVAEEVAPRSVQVDGEASHAQGDVGHVLKLRLEGYVGGLAHTRNGEAILT